MTQQLALNFDVSATQRRKRALQREKATEQPTLFASWSANIDVHLQSAAEAVASISGPEPDRGQNWLAGVVGSARTITARRAAFPARRLDRLLYVRPPARVTLDAAARAVGLSIWADKLGLRPLRVVRDRQRLFGHSPRWPGGMRVVDAPWSAISTLLGLGIELDVAEDAGKLLRQKLSQTGSAIAEASLAGSAVSLRTSQPRMVEDLRLPGLSHVGDPHSGQYKLPLLSSDPLLTQRSIHVPDKLRQAITKVTGPAAPLTPALLGDGFPWTLYDFQAEDAGRAARILETTGGVLLAGDMGSGKSIHPDTELLTPAGTVKAGNVDVGDLLVGVDGKPTRVLGVFPQPARPLWNVTLSDGQTITADGQHLWTVYDQKQIRWFATTTDQIRAGKYGDGRWMLPQPKPVRFTGGHRPDAYGAGLAAAALTPCGDDVHWGDNMRFADRSSRQAFMDGVRDAIGREQGDGTYLAPNLGPGGSRIVRHMVETLGGVCTPNGDGGLLVAPPGHACARRSIVDISPASPGRAVCFHVGSQHHLFLSAGGVPLHNTTVALSLVHYLNIWPLLVVAPPSAFSTWERQFDEMGRSAYLATEASKKVWGRVVDGGFDAVVINFDKLAPFTELFAQVRFAGIVADEIQRIRTAGSNRSRQLRQLASAVPMRIGLSGTPMTNTVSDLLPVGAFLSPGEWRPRANTKDLADMYPGDPIEGVAEHLGSLMVRRRMEDTGATLPSRSTRRVKVQLTVEQRRALVELEAEVERAKQGGEFDNPQGRMHAFAKLHRQKQIINCPEAAGVPGVNPKVQAAMDLASQFLDAGRNGVMFCADRTTFRNLAEELDRREIGWVGIWGSTPTKDRIVHERMFHEGATAPNGHPTRVVLCTIQAGSESWSASPTATWLISTSYMYAPAMLSQMECRVYRLNSDSDGPDIEICYVHAQGPGGTLDDRMVEILEAKKELFAQVVDRTSYQDDTQVHMSMGDLMYLLTGEKDERRAAMERDSDEVVEREQAARNHAKATLYRHKRGNADLVPDGGSEAVTREEYNDDLDDMLAWAETDDEFDPDDLL